MTAILIALMAILPPCATEDSTNCGWDATNHGNGVGASFVDLNGTAYTVPGELDGPNGTPANAI